MKEISINRRTGVTLIEIVVGTLIISIVFYAVSSFASNMAFKYKHGFVDLENFRVAHQAVNMLRRDYKMACPYITAGDGIEEMKKFLLTPLAVSAGAARFVGANRRIRVTSQQLVFFKFADTGFSSDPEPMVEEVEYRFDSDSGCLIRSCGGQSSEFKGFKEVEFKSFVHEANPHVPVLWAKIVLSHEYYKDSDKPLELTVSLSSSFVADSINRSDWQYRTFHKIK